MDEVDRVSSLGMKPRKILFPSFLRNVPGEGWDSVTPIPGKELFGLPTGFADKLVVVPEGYLAVWGDKEIHGTDSSASAG